jgi:hypothetical protein
MPRYEITSPEGRTIVIEGSAPPTQEQAAQIFSQFKVSPQRSFGEKVGGAFDAAATVATGAIAQPVAGLVGVGNLIATGDPINAGQRVKQVQQNLTYQPGQVGQEYLQNIGEAPVLKQIGETAQGASDYAGRTTLDITGSPAAASIASALPEAAGAALGVFVPGGIAARQASKADEVTMAGVQAARQGARAVEDLAGSQTSKALQSLSKRKIRDIVDADPSFYKALDDLGITAEPLPSYASRNPQFRGIEQSFAALPNSPQNAQSLAFAKDVSNIAHALLETAEGAGESVATSMKWRDASMKTIDELGVAADEAYDALDQVLDKRMPAEPTKTLEFLNDFTRNLPVGIDDPDVPAALKKAYASLQPRQVSTESGVQMVPANLESMDRLRKNIGAAAFKREGDFKDADSALLKRLYGSLTDDINAMAAKQGLDEQVGAAKALTAQRKVLESQMQNLIGSKLQKDIVPVVQTGLKGLRSGGAQKYQEIMRNIPDPELRTELILTSMSDMFTKTMKGEKQFGTMDYLKWYNDTLGNDGVRKVIAKDLPENVLSGLDSLAKISQGVARATAQKIPTGVVNSVLNDQTGMLSRMVGITGRAAGRTLQATPMMQETGSAIISAIASKGNRADAVRDLLADPEFSNMIRRSVAQGVVQGNKQTKGAQLAEQRLAKKANYKAWEQTLTESEKAKIASVGVASFLLSQEGIKDD